MHRPASSVRPSPQPRSKPHKSSKPSWNDSQRDGEEYRISAQQLIEKKLRLMSKEQLCRIAGIAAPQPAQRRPVSSDARTHDALQPDKENMTRPTHRAQQKEQQKPLTPATAAAAAAAASIPSSAPLPLAQIDWQANVPASSRNMRRGRVVVQPVTTPSPSPPVSAVAAVVTSVAASPSPAASSLSFEPWSRNALLSPVMERSLEMGDDDENINDSTQPPPPSPSTAPLPLTPDKKAQLVLEEVRERLKQLSAEPAAPAPAAAVVDIEPAAAVAAVNSPLQRRLHAALLQVAAQVDEMTSRRAEEEAERRDVRQQLTAAHERIRLLEAVSTASHLCQHRVTSLCSLCLIRPFAVCCLQSVSQLESSQSELQSQLLRLQSGNEQQLASIIHSLTRLERRSAEPPPPRSPSSGAPPLAPAPAAATAAPLSFPLPPPFVSSQLAAPPASPPTPGQHSAAPSASSGSASLTESCSTAAQDDTALSFHSPARSGRSPRRVVLRYEEVSRVEQSVIEMDAGDEQDDDGSDEEEQQSEAQRSLLVTPTPAAPPAHMDVQPAARRRAGWPLSSVGWTVQLR